VYTRGKCSPHHSTHGAGPISTYVSLHGRSDGEMSKSTKLQTIWTVYTLKTQLKFSHCSLQNRARVHLPIYNNVIDIIWSMYQCTTQCHGSAVPKHDQQTIHKPHFTCLLPMYMSITAKCTTRPQPVFVKLIFISIVSPGWAWSHNPVVNVNINFLRDLKVSPKKRIYNDSNNQT